MKILFRLAAGLLILSGPAQAASLELGLTRAVKKRARTVSDTVRRQRVAPRILWQKCVPDA